MSVRGPGAAWKQESVVADFLDGRRQLIPLWDGQEELVRRLISRGARRIRRVCDLGAGDGGFARLVMDVHPEATAVLVDFSEPMLAAARALPEAKDGRWEIVEADLASSAWLDRLPSQERFDAVVSRFCIHHLPDARKRELYEEVFRHLEPGGLFLNWEHVAPGGLVEGLFDEYFVERMLEAERERANPRSPEDVRRAYDDAADDDILCAVETQCDWLREIGFEQVDVYFKLPELAIIGGTRGTG
jgi:tRNA (cmo5U34)-methyltransferase